MPFEPSFVFTADLHLRPQTWARYPGIRNDAYESLRAITDYCHRTQLPLFIGGDIFQSKRPDPVSVTEFNYALVRMAPAGPGWNVYYIQGNHDDCGDTPWPDVGVAHNIVHLPGMTCQFMQREIRGLDWTPREHLREALAAIPDTTSILVCHQSWDALQGIGSTDGEIDWVPDHIEVLLTGDYHVRTTVAKQRASGKPLIIHSPGSTYLYRMGESPDKYFLVVGQVNGQLHIEEVRIPTRKLHTLAIHTAEQLDGCCQTDLAGILHVCRDLPEAIRKPIIRVSYRDDIPDVYQRLRDFFGEQVHFFPDPIHVADEVTVDLGDDPETFDTLEGSIRRLEEDSEIADGVLRVLNAGDMSVEIDKMYQEHCGGYYDPARASG